MKDDRKTIEKVLKVIIGLNIVSIIVSILSLIGR